MPEFSFTHQINAPVERVWEILDDFGDIQRWNPGVKRSSLTSDGPVREGSTRHCNLKPFGAVDERIEAYEPNQHLQVRLYETSKMPLTEAVVDFDLKPHEGGTELTISCDLTLNRLGRLTKGVTVRQMRKAMGSLATGLQEESERVPVA